MFIEVVKSKIHRVTVTEANLNYIGSITVDEDLLDAANLIANDVYGVSVAMANHEVTHNPLSEIAGKTKFVTPDCQMVRVAQNMGISFGSK